ncbi:hypothetical protein [Luteithermobacter gelatinilyticus]|uniref:hypothetical protein n=1 Tax=Luteithermobacter gelatinilyticus TaxID=2582913 RepID=UPI0011074D54|nr:hypothetical protein [Luteithermobacter gelatinilyticus]
MTVAVGETVYNEGKAPCSGLGLTWSDDDLDAAMKGPVVAILFDDVGKADIEDILTGLAETEFEQEGLRRVLADPDDIEDWRIGEAIAETYLTDHRDCYFPWPDGRDERKRGSSLPGADLVGLHNDGQGNCLAFGEVKTSSEDKHPPGAMHGRTGLKQQLEDLRDNVSIRDDLVKYLGFRAKGAKWIHLFQQAAQRYLRNNSDVQLYGFLVRDVEPHKNDLRARVKKLAEDCPGGTRIELLALYLPKGRIEGIGKAAVAARAGGAS